MTSKKSLSDLLREEVQKTPDNEPPTVDADSQTAKRSRVATAQLENTIGELSAALEVVTQRANALQEQVTSLETELQQNKKLVESLQAQLQQAVQTQSALEEQKTLVKKLQTEVTQTQATQSELEAQKQRVQELSAELQQAQQHPNPPLPLLQTKNKVKRPILAESPSTVLSNEEIGWFD